MTFPRSSGILCHPTSFPSRYGIGDLGKGAYDFLEWLAAAKQQLWQVLPLGPTGYGDSPYQCFSAFAGNPLLISPEGLAWSGLLPHDALVGCAHVPRSQGGLRPGHPIQTGLAPPQLRALQDPRDERPAQRLRRVSRAERKGG